MAYERRTTIEIDESGAYFFPHGSQGGVMVAVDFDGDKRWAEWLMAADNNSFRVIAQSNTFTARKELRGRWSYWYAYKKISRKLYKMYIGESTATTPRQLELIGDCFKSINRRTNDDQ